MNFLSNFPAISSMHSGRCAESNPRWKLHPPSSSGSSLNSRQCAVHAGKHFERDVMAVICRKLFRNFARLPTPPVIPTHRLYQGCFLWNNAAEKLAWIQCLKLWAWLTPPFRPFPLEPGWGNFANLLSDMMLRYFTSGFHETMVSLYWIARPLEIFFLVKMTTSVYSRTKRNRSSVNFPPPGENRTSS